MNLQKIITVGIATLCCIISVSFTTLAQQRITISPFYSDFGLITDKAYQGYSMSPLIQVSVKVEFPSDISFEELGKYEFQRPTMHHQLIWQFMPVELRYGELSWNDLTLLNWNQPPLTESERAVIKEGKHRFTLYYNAPSFIAGLLTDKDGILSFSYVHIEGWESLCPFAPHREDSITVVFNVNPSLFYLVADVADMDLHQNNSVSLSKEEGIPDFALFYRPVYQEREVHYKGINIRFIEMNRPLAIQILDKIHPNPSRKNDDVNTNQISSLEQLEKAIGAIEEVIEIDNNNDTNIDLVKTGLNITLIAGQKNDEDTLKSRISLSRDNYLLLDNDMFYSHTLIHELLHHIFPTIINESSPQESFFYNESIIEYLAKYIYGKYVVGEDLFMEEHALFNEARYQAAKEAIEKDVSNSVSFGSSNKETLDTAEVYYKILPYLLHQIALQSGKQENEFVKVLIHYIQNNDDKDTSFQNLCSYLRRNGFAIKENNEIETLLP